MRSFTKSLKYLLTACLAAVLIWIVFNFSLVEYGFAQLRGQLHIINASRPVSEVMNDPSVADTIKDKFRLIANIRAYAIDSLGLKETKNYTTFFDQKNKPLLWVITASEPYRLKPYQWHFPVIGSVSYKGFFDYPAGLEESKQLKAEGYDVDYSDVSAWSTLGWFTDPILSNMLKRGEGRIAELIIHEMTHATLYVKSNVNFNENLASVCGEEGAIKYLSSKYGEGSPQLNEFIFYKEDYDLFSDHMLKGAHTLDSLYNTLTDSIALIKKKSKDELIRTIVASLDSLPFHNKTRYKNLFVKKLPDNAFFIDFIRYDAQKSEMKRELETRFNGNIRLYLDDLRRRM